MYQPDAKESQDVKWNEFTLIVPAVSVGNVGQLTADLLICTLYMNKVGYLCDDSILPMVGNDPYTTNSEGQICNLVTGAQVYMSASLKLIVIQQRAPFVKGKRGQFCEKLMSWIQEKQFRQVVIVTSSHAHMRTDTQLQGSQLRYLATPEFDALTQNSVEENLHWMRLEPSENPLQSQDSDLYIPGGGLAKTLFSACKLSHVAAVCVLTFCAEGENAVDAIQLATFLNQYLKVADEKNQFPTPGNVGRSPWKIPISWNLLYGNSVDQMIY
ncbi:proteasome assembly chaperone 2-like [Lineus longissimus]|uniref:proteasome assembly chaperone 2-like n=1 Tax=Lineus longissimus TaxID=88925 RepID=UPI002B4C4BF4